MTEPSAPPAAQPAAAPLSPSPTSAGSGQGSAAVCVVVGITLVVAGLYNLAINPSGSDSPLSGATVNLQALFMGITFFTSGSVFLAAAWRPR
jgi:hypothetical protein